MVKGIGSLSNEIAKALKEYTTEVSEGLEEAKIEVAKSTVKNLKSTSPKDTGQYRHGWTRKKIGNAQIVHNSTSYQLTHLLEKGHVKIKGGRVSAKPHIGPAEEAAIKEYMIKVEKVIRG